MSEKPLPDPVRLRAELGLPPIGTKLTREQALLLHRAMWGEPDPGIAAQIRARFAGQVDTHSA